MTSRGQSLLRICVIVLAIGAGVAGAGQAAAKPKIDSTVSLKAEEPEQQGEDFTFRGRVRSSETACENHRRVRITANEGSSMSPPIVEGTVRADQDGRYKLEVPAEANEIGNYRATALEKAKADFVCKQARSPIVN